MMNSMSDDDYIDEHDDMPYEEFDIRRTNQSRAFHDLCELMDKSDLYLMV